MISSFKSKINHGNIALIRRFSDSDGGNLKPVLFFHGATVPTLLTSAYRIDGLSWFDALTVEGRPIYGLDLLGYGESDPYPELPKNKSVNPSDYGSGLSLIEEIDEIVNYIAKQHETEKIHIIAISRGAIPAGYYATTYPEKVQSITFHGPITRQVGLGEEVTMKYFGSSTLPSIGHFSLSARDRFNLFRDDRPFGTQSPLESSFSQNWMNDYSERVHGDRNKIDDPIKAPIGFAVDIINAWNDIYFDESHLVMPTLILRGEWDKYLTPAISCQQLFEKISSPQKLYLQLPEGTHSMMFEKCRHSVHQFTKQFLNKHD